MNSKVVQWIVEHDDKWLFTAFYIGLSVILSIAISLFWLVVVVLFHAALEWFALQKKGEKRILLNLFWHLKLDFGLVFFALCLGIYMDAAFGLVGLGAAARTGTQISTRFIIWQRTVRGVLLTLDDAAQVTKAVFVRQNSPDDNPVEALPWQNKWSIGDWVSVSLFFVCFFLIVFSPIFLNQSISELIETLTKELHPWP